MTALYRILFAVLVILNTTIADIFTCATPYCCTNRDGSGPIPPIPPIPGIGNNSFMNSLGNHNGPSVGNIGGNISTTGLTEYLNKQNVDNCRTLDLPGVYMLGEPLKLPDDDHATFASCQTAGLIITSSDVTIDLNGFSITYGGDNLLFPPPSFDAILIAPGVRNVTIKNGSIRGFNIGAGIRATSAVAVGSNDGIIQQIVLSDLMIQDNKAGVTFDGTLNAMKLINITTSNISSNKSYGVKYINVNTGKLSSVTASENYNLEGDAQGIWLEDCSNIDMFAVDTERNSATGGTGYGILADTCNKINIYHSNANYNTGDTGSPSSYGIALTDSNNCLFNSNNANENAIGFADDQALTTSLFIANSAYKNGNPGLDTELALIYNYNIVSASGGYAVNSETNIGSLLNFIKPLSYHAPQLADNWGKFWNFSFTN